MNVSGILLGIQRCRKHWMPVHIIQPDAGKDYLRNWRELLEGFMLSWRARTACRAIADGQVGPTGQGFQCGADRQDLLGEIDADEDNVHGLFLSGLMRFPDPIGALICQAVRPKIHATAELRRP